MRNIKIVDVFSSTPFKGNPVAVVMEADGLSDSAMQGIAAWTNLSETTFHLRPTVEGADYRLRIFTPRSELPFAGHPTLGSAHALLEAGLVTPRSGQVVQECGAGLVPVAIEDGMLRLRMPKPHIRELTAQEGERLVTVLGTPLAEGTTAAMIDVGPRWIVAELRDAEAVIALQPDMAACAALEHDLNATGVTVFGTYPAGEVGIEVRSFAPGDGVPEDPVCGSGNGAVAIYRVNAGSIAEGAAYVATQGQCVGRTGRIEINVRNGEIFVGGAAVTTVNGTIAT